MSLRFRGEFNHNIDPKGRVSVPSKFRDLLEGTFWITKSQESCLWIYTGSEWEIFEDKLLSLPTTTDPMAKALSRHFLSGAAEMEVDKQGRILIPPALREYAGLDKEVVFLGVGNRAELWSKKAWDEYNSALNIDDCTTHVQSLGLSI